MLDNKKISVLHENNEVDVSCMQSTGTENLAPVFSDDQDYYIHSEDADDDEVVNDEDTTTSFSLQECMNEFRARRIRRALLQQNRKDAEKSSVTQNLKYDAGEIDLINQNLCNKEQERKCKPCKDGFCYCFTSDSGDGSTGALCAMKIRNLRRNRHSECGQFFKASNINGEKHKSKEIDKNPQNLVNACKAKNIKTSKKELKVISSLEASQRDAPFINIIQEIHDNCVISEVRVNKYKIQSSQRNTHLKKKDVHSKYITTKNKDYLKERPSLKKNHIESNSTCKPLLELSASTAPILERISKTYTAQSTESLISPPLENQKKYIQCFESNFKAGGMLLQKRLSSTQCTYKPRNQKKPPPKPPRSSLSYDNKYESTSSTSPSVRKAEQVVEKFLSKKCFKAVNDISNDKKSRINRSEPTKSSNKYENCKRKTELLILKETNKVNNHTENIPSTYPSLSDIEGVAESKSALHYGENIRPTAENLSKIINIGWTGANFIDMLNYDSNTKKFHSESAQVQPQRPTNRDIECLKNPIGWHNPHKIDLDTVDGVARYNLASNIENKNTPVKAKFTSSKKTKITSQAKKFLWSEHLRQLSPWSNKNNINNFDRHKSLGSSSKSLLKLSKRKILHLVSPKKDNKDRANFGICKTSRHNVGVQTSCNDISSHFQLHSGYERSSTTQSPPGSYHSPIQLPHIQSSSQNTVSNSTYYVPSSFDFSRIVHSPLKKTPRSSQRKLNFPLDCTLSCNGDVGIIPAHANEEKTYRSFNTEFNQDVSISKISCILRNIRAKLEETDEQAMQTFLETEHHGQSHLSGIDCTDSHLKKPEDPKDAIYSEIEDNSIHILERPNFDNHSGIQHYNLDHNPEIFYAKVNKCNKHLDQLKQHPQIPLAKIMQDSLKSKKKITNTTQLPPLPETSGSETALYLSPKSVTRSLSHGQSLNNIRLTEQNLMSKKQRNFSKSDQSLYHSKIFLENLYESELIMDCGAVKRGNFENVRNNTNHRSYVSMTQLTPNNIGISYNNEDLRHKDAVSYELPKDGVNESIVVDDSATTGTNLVLSTRVSPLSQKQSTPKKQSFITKDDRNRSKLNVPNDCQLFKKKLRCCGSHVPQKLSITLNNNQWQSSPKLNEVSEYDVKVNSNSMPSNTLPRYKCLKIFLHTSFQKSKKFIESERKRLSTALNFLTNGLKCPILSQETYVEQSLNPNLDDLYLINESAPVCEQIARTVSICRKLPNFETSTEMVEAERLLLFSALHGAKQHIPKFLLSQNINKQIKIRFSINDMYLPIRTDVNRDIFFNYFYIVTFEYAGIIKSTLSAECENGTAVFRDCGIEFELCSELKKIASEKYQYKQQNGVRCNVFMLRLRKVSTFCVKPQEEKTKELLTRCPSPTLTSSSSIHEIVSRFRLHASFTLDASDFVPYEYVSQESNNSDRICIRACSVCDVPLIPRTKSTNILRQLRLKGKSEISFPKFSFASFLNVEDPYLQHNWNRRWCTLDGIYLQVWQDISSLNKSPLMVIDLRDSKRSTNYPLTSSPRELCARPRSFYLKCTIRKAEEDISVSTVFFAAETQEALDSWLKNLNIALNFIATWMS